MFQRDIFVRVGLQDIATNNYDMENYRLRIVLKAFFFFVRATVVTN